MDVIAGFMAGEIKKTSDRPLPFEVHNTEFNHVFFNEGIGNFSIWAHRRSPSPEKSYGELKSSLRTRQLRQFYCLPETGLLPRKPGADCFRSLSPGSVPTGY